MNQLQEASFENRKNIRAGTITVAILVLLFLFLLLTGWTNPTLNQPPIDEGMEVNLGNSDAGMGKDQPFEPGQPSPKEQQAYTPPQPAVAHDEPVKEPVTDEKDPEAPEIKKPPVTKPEATKIAEKPVAKKEVVKKTETPVPPAPVPPKPKAVFKGVNGTGTGGNDADTYKKGGSEGIAGGKGDQGRPGGDPNSKNYTGGGHGNGGVSVVRGDRQIVGNFSFTGDFDENAIVYADIKVAPDGSGQFLQITKPTTNRNHVYIDLITQNLHKLKFTRGTEESIVNVQFNFRIKN